MLVSTPASPVTRPSLLLRLRDPGDAESWRQFEAPYGDLIVRYCRRRGLQLADAEDIRQVVLAKLATSLRRFEYDTGRGRFRDYLNQCVRNAIASEFARHNRQGLPVCFLEALDTPPATDDNDTQWHEEWVRHHYRRAVRTLRLSCGGQTMAVFDAILQGRSFGEIADQFEMTQAAVRKIKQRVRDRLREVIARQVEDEALPSDNRSIR